jgi:hypothetical protein
MNANELANEIMEHYKAELPRGFNVNWMQEAATMLRAQQSEIEALKYEKSSGVYDLAKTLTDEEIWEVVNLKWWDWEDSFDVTGFARAILKKASEK